MGCCAKFSKFIIGACNVIIVIAALVAGIFLYVKFGKEDWAEFIKNQVPAQFILAVACFAVLSAIFGMFAGCCKKKCCSVLYLVMIIIVIMLEALAVTVAILYDEKLLNEINDKWYREDMKSARIAVEKNFECCGFLNSTEHPDRLTECGFNYTEAKVQEDDVPFCKNKLEDTIKDNLKAIMIAGIVLVVFELVLLLCAIYLVCYKGDGSSSDIARF